MKAPKRYCPKCGGENITEEILNIPERRSMDEEARDRSKAGQYDTVRLTCNSPKIVAYKTVYGPDKKPVLDEKGNVKKEAVWKECGYSVEFKHCNPRITTDEYVEKSRKIDEQLNPETVKAAVLEACKGMFVLNETFQTFGQQIEKRIRTANDNQRNAGTNETKAPANSK